MQGERERFSSAVFVCFFLVCLFNLLYTWGSTLFVQNKLCTGMDFPAARAKWLECSTVFLLVLCLLFKTSVVISRFVCFHLCVVKKLCKQVIWCWWPACFKVMEVLPASCSYSVCVCVCFWAVKTYWKLILTFEPQVVKECRQGSLIPGVGTNIHRSLLLSTVQIYSVKKNGQYTEAALEWENTPPTVY